MHCPRCSRPSIHPNTLLFRMDDAVEQLLALDCRVVRTKSSLYTAIQKGKVTTRTKGRSGVSFFHCDLARLVSPFTTEEEARIAAFDREVQKSLAGILRRSLDGLASEMFDVSDIADAAFLLADDAEYGMDTRTDDLARKIDELDAYASLINQKLRTAKRRLRVAMREVGR